MFRDGFVFTASDIANVYDAVVIRNPSNAVNMYSLGISSHTLEEHISLIRQYNLKKAVIIADDISFLSRCPSLNWIWVQPSWSAPDGFDFSPLYQLPNLSFLRCETVYGKSEDKHGVLDYRKTAGLERVYINGEQEQLHFDELPSLCQLSASGVKHRKTVNEFFSSPVLKHLDLSFCGIESLDGIEKSTNLEEINLEYNRKLHDISALSRVADTLKVLHILNCPKITDFSCLCSLTQLDVLDLHGNNLLPNLGFLQKMKNLKLFSFSMNVSDGNLDLCKTIPCVYSERNRKHYNLKDTDLPKDMAPIRAARNRPTLC